MPVIRLPIYTVVAAATLLAGLLLSVTGCRNSVPPPPAAVQKQPDIELSHEFGLLRPGQQVKHRFAIRNDSALPWKVADIENQCKCTGALPVSETAKPGETLEIDVGYAVQSDRKEDSRMLRVNFLQRTAPRILLKIHCTIREPISVSPGSVVMRAPKTGQPVHEDLVVSNYLDHDLKLPQVTCQAPWLKVDLQSTSVADEPYPARQSWRARVVAETAKLQPGKHHAQIEIKTDSPENPLKTVPIDLVVGGPVEVIPSELLFGSVTSGKPVVRKVLIRGADGAITLNCNSVKFEHNLGSRLTLECRQLSTNVLELSAGLAPHADDKNIHGQIHVTFKDAQTPPLEIPVSASIE
jgi:hypothetical protein